MLREVIEGEMEGVISILETVENDYVCIGFVGKPRYETRLPYKNYSDCFAVEETTLLQT